MDTIHSKLDKETAGRTCRQKCRDLCRNSLLIFFQRVELQKKQQHKIFPHVEEISTFVCDIIGNISYRLKHRDIDTEIRAAGEIDESVPYNDTPLKNIPNWLRTQETSF